MLEQQTGVVNRNNRADGSLVSQPLRFNAQTKNGVKNRDNRGDGSLVSQGLRFNAQTTGVMNRELSTFQAKCTCTYF